jgi:hypothetical protein
LDRELHAISLNELPPDWFNPLKYAFAHDALHLGVIGQQRLQSDEIASIECLDVCPYDGLGLFFHRH